MSDFLKEGWLKTRLGECCQILDSLRIPVSEIERAKRIGRYPYYGANGIQGYINDFIFEGPSVLLAEDGGYFDEYSSRPIAQYVTGKYWVNNHAHILKGKIGFDTKWIFYALVHKNILKYINSGTRAKLNQGDLREIELLAPPLKEQQKIAEILTSVDDVIENTQSQINKLEDLKKATMNELLTKGIGHTEFKDTEIGRIPRTWSCRTLGGVIKQVMDFRGKTPLKIGMTWGGGTIRALSANNVKTGGIDFSAECNFASDELYEKWMTSGHLQKHDLLFTMEAPLGKVALVPDNERYLLSQRVIAIRTCDLVDSEFMYYYLCSDGFQRELARNATGTTATGIQQKKLLLMNVTIPPSDEQHRISEIIHSLDDKLEAQKQKLSAQQLLKKSLIQDLLTGKVRVTVN